MEAVDAVVRAIRDEGTNPPYHRAIMAKHRMDWPSLWEALDELVKEYDAKGDL